MNSSEEPVLEAGFPHNIHCSFLDGVFYRRSINEGPELRYRQQFTGMVVLSLLLKTPREQTLPPLLSPQGKFPFAPVASNTPNVFLISVCKFTIIKEFSELFSLLCFIPCLRTPGVDRCTLRCAFRYMSMTRGWWMKKLLPQSKVRERGVETHIPFTGLEGEVG